MIDDTLLADRPRLRMEVERLARDGAVVYLNPALQEEADYNMLRLLYVTCQRRFLKGGFQTNP